MLNTILRLIKEPLVHFLAIGTALFVIWAYWGQPDVEEQGKSITITAGEIKWLTDNWEKLYSRPPTAEEREGLINQYLKDWRFHIPPTRSPHRIREGEQNGR